jgi:hypothetical protein
MLELFLPLLLGQIILVGEVNDLRSTREQLASEVKALEADAELLQDLYGKQDAVLGEY